MNPSPEELLFAAASGFDDERERRAFLDLACQNDARMRERLDEMLEIEGDAATFFEFQPEVEPEVEPMQKEPEQEGIGAHIGRYRLIARIGAGGCGVVYYAEQEEPVRRKVALKLVKLGMDTEAVIARFGLERQALAQMDHPNIARVLDAGATASGRPYFVMELVEGEKITDFCDASHFNIRQRLELFVEVCNAIQHAHQKGVIHRDIKPSNVLARSRDGVATPKVIDFGIAKAAAATMAWGETFTQFGQFLGTPDYMSPEQAQGSAEVDTRSDIYSLGVLLYELLSGRTPFDLKKLTDNALDEVRRIVREEEPKPPSVGLKLAGPEEGAAIATNRGTNSQHLASQLAGDLDWIVMKAMEKERSRRYDTVNGLAMDVLRHLNDDVVLARPPSRAYRLGKLVRRNKVVFAAGSIAVFGLLAGFGTSTWMFFREKEARQQEARLRANEERLREKAERREDVAHAAVKIKYGDLSGADDLLAKVPVEQTPSSLEAAQAFGAVADWHRQSGRLKEAASRYTSMFRAIGSVDSSDLPAVSVNLLPASAAVAYAGPPEAYEEIRRMAIERFGATTHGAVAEQTLKACILRPADPQILKSLAPLAAIVEEEIERQQGLMGTDFHYTAWGCFAVSLWNYRLGEFPKAAAWGKRCLAFPNDNEARIASMLILRAMIEHKSGQLANARTSLAQGGERVGKVFASKTWMKPQFPVSWFEWVNAAVLLGEAQQLVGK